MSHTLAPARGTDLSPVSPRRIFAAAARSEWIKLRTVRSTIWALVLTVVFTIGLGALFTAIEVNRWDHRTLTEVKGFGSLSDPGVLRAVVGGALHLVLIGAIAVALGAAMRRTAGAVAVLLVVPGLVTLLPAPWNNDITRYLPNSAARPCPPFTRSPTSCLPREDLSCCAPTRQPP